MNAADVNAQLDAARSAFKAGNLAQAGALSEQVLAEDATNIGALSLLGNIAFAMNNFDLAAEHFQRWTTLDPTNPIPHLSLGELRTQQGRFEESIDHYDSALSLDPESTRAIAGKANTFERRGDRDAARALVQPLVLAGKESPEMAIVQARLDLHDEAFERVRGLADRHILRGMAGNEAMRHLLFLRGKAQERLGDYDDAFESYRRGNEIVPSPYQHAHWQRHFDQLIRTCTAEFMASLPKADHGSERPIFIVGMPRTGSTLLESMLDAHPEMHGVGEFPLMAKISNTLPMTLGVTVPYPACLEYLTLELVNELAASYLEETQRLDPPARRSVDKFLNNYLHLALIAQVFPRARVLNCRRKPEDTCISCYAEPLWASGAPFASDLTHLGLAYRNYDRLMRHWVEVLELRILDVHYEDLVADTETTLRGVLDFCSMDWDDACLEFHAVKRSVQTASYDQVNRPVYKRAVGRARHFHDHLQPLYEALGDAYVPAGDA